MDVQQILSLDSSFSTGLMMKNVVDREMDFGTPMVTGVEEEEEVFVVERRSSRRIQNLPKKKKRDYYYDSWKEHCKTSNRKGRISSSTNNNNKKIKTSSSSSRKVVEMRRDFSSLEEKNEVFIRGSGVGDDDVELPESVVNVVGLKEMATTIGVIDLSGKSDHAKVKETLRAFNAHYLHFVQEEEKRCQKKQVEDDGKSPKGSKPKKVKACEDDMKLPAKQSDLKAVTKKKKAHGTAKRPDLKAITKMMETNTILYPEKRWGPFPGVDIGHQFYSRAEMVVLGFHGHWLNGIDFMGPSYEKMEKYKDYTFPLAVSIMLSGQYEDDQDDAEDVIYTGQGGNNLLGNRHQKSHQVMRRGNLALKNNIDQCIPVRVTRGHVSRSSYCGKVYTYDGLYKVVQCWEEAGISGYRIYKFRLKRLEGQPPLTTNQVHYAGRQAPIQISKLRGLVSDDISGGQEDIPIPATNVVDDPPVAPTGYSYSKSILVAENVKLPPSVSGCDCRGTCTDPLRCACARLNGSDFPYVRRDGGRLVKAKSVVFECGPNCGCGPGCVNKTSQRGLKYRFEVFRTAKKGWAVRSWDYIPSGAPICEYTGLLMRNDVESDNFSENNYIFDIDCLQTMKGLDGRERRLEDVAVPSHDHLAETDDKKLESVPEFCINAGSTGNIARFINHSCAPNLFVQCILISHHNIKLARVMLFAADNIPPYQELAYDYGYALDSVMDPDGNIRRMECHCGAADCRKRLY